MTTATKQPKTKTTTRNGRAKAPRRSSAIAAAKAKSAKGAPRKSKRPFLLPRPMQRRVATVYTNRGSMVFYVDRSTMPDLFFLTFFNWISKEGMEQRIVNDAVPGRDVDKVLADVLADYESPAGRPLSLSDVARWGIDEHEPFDGKDGRHPAFDARTGKAGPCWPLMR